MSAPVVVTLKEPIQFGSDTVTELRLRPPKAKDFRGMPLDMKLGDLLDLAGRLSAQPKPVIDELGLDDLNRVMEIIGDFVPGGRGTGSTPSP